MAIVSRHRLENVARRAFCGLTDARHIEADVTINGNRLTIQNYYVPSGGDDPNVDTHPKFAHKLLFLEELKTLYARDRRSRSRTILVGDLNIAPLETDVWSHKPLLKVVSHTPVETEGLNRVMNEGGWVDAMRSRIPPGEHLYTWWSYRSPNWEKSNRGRRLDHIWITGDLQPALRSVDVLKPARGWERPSDHAPVIADFEIA